ncbi:MAG: methyltetrahydrofolate cobalamin methyltransferase [Candidatus Omnitrophica bacterium]|nr:methyltetrahydrofolate cobalamin methyltransferase [Candidatus Omnitrophota bacterium]
MIIIGERINTSRESVSKAVREKDASFIIKEAKRQAEAGANFIDLNCGTLLDNEPDAMAWLVETVQSDLELSLCIDSPNAAAIEAGLKVCRKPALINSITGEKKRLEEIAPLANKYNASLIALTMDDKGVPSTAQDRVRIAKSLLDSLSKFEINAERIYFDPIVQPISSGPDQGAEFLKAIRLIKELPGAKVVCGLSNISYGLPNRRLINSTLLSMALLAGLDAAILDPLDKSIISNLRASEALLGEDEYCMNYIKSFRENKLISV